jgi:hypothetical protein
VRLRATFNTVAYSASRVIRRIRYRVWRTSYDFVSVHRLSKEDFRALWKDSGEGKKQLDLVETEFRSSSGSIYDFMVARAEDRACNFMHPLMIKRQPVTAESKASNLFHKPDHSEMCGCANCKAELEPKQKIEGSSISPFELALAVLYVHEVDKKQKKSFNLLDENLYRSKERFMAALEVVEMMLDRDDERAKRASKVAQKKRIKDDTSATKDKDDIQKMHAVQKNCKSALNFHYKFHSGSTNNGFIRGALFCALVTFCAIWMATSPSAESIQWQSSISSMVQAELAPSYPDVTSFRTALAAFSVPWPSDDSFTRPLGSAELRVIRLNTQSSSSCLGSDNLTCVPTISLFPSLSINMGMLPPQAYSSTPSTFSVPPFSNSFKYHQRDNPIRCGTVYCFDGSGYTFQAADSSEYLAAVRSSIFDSSVRAVIISFALYSPSLQAAYKGSYIAELLPTGNVLGSFDAFVFEYVDAIGLDRTVLAWNKLLWAVKILVSARSLPRARFSHAEWHRCSYFRSFTSSKSSLNICWTRTTRMLPFC